jgi:hypothetical protein
MHCRHEIITGTGKGKKKKQQIGINPYPRGNPARPQCWRLIGLSNCVDVMHAPKACILCMLAVLLFG